MSNSLIEIPAPHSESEILEYKPNASDLQGIGATLCAFLNGQGGRILIGFDESGSYVTITNAAQRAEEIERFLNDHIVPLSLWSLSVQETSDGDWIEIAVPEGTDKPYLFEDQIYSRAGVQTSKATAAQIRALMKKDTQQPTRWERQLAPNLKLEDLDSKEIEEAAFGRDGFAERVGYLYNADAELIGTLNSLSLYSYGSFTNAARVLFDRKPALRLPQTRVRLTRFATDKGGDFIDDQTLEGHAFHLIENTNRLLRNHIETTVEFETEKLTAIVTPAYSFAALREALVNAFVHRDYASFQGGVSVGVYPNRIEIWNSGRLPESLAVRDLKRVHPSLPFNPDIAHVFHRRGYMERLGTGTLRIIEACRKLGAAEPQWKSSDSGVTLTFWRALNEIKSLNTRQQDLINRLKPSEVLVPGDYYSSQDVSERQGRRDLVELEELGYLTRQNSGRATVYIRTKN